MPSLRQWSNESGPSKTKSPPESKLDNATIDWGPIEPSLNFSGLGKHMSTTTRPFCGGLGHKRAFLV